MNLKKSGFIIFISSLITLSCATNPVFVKTASSEDDQADKKWTMQKEIRGDIAYLEESKSAKEERLMELNKGRGGALYKLWKDHLDHPSDPARFNKWFQHAMTYDKNKEAAEVAAEKEKVGKEIKRLDLKVRKLKQEADELWNIQHPPAAAGPGPSPDIESLQGEIKNLQSLLDMAEESLRLAEEWEAEYPKEGWDSQVQYWKLTKKQLEDQLKSAHKSLSERMKDLPHKEPSSQESATPPVTEKPLTAEPHKAAKPKTRAASAEEERKETERWIAKGFTPLEIKVLKGGGSFKDETGNVISGWPPNRTKQSLSFLGRLKKQLGK